MCVGGTVQEQNKPKPTPSLNTIPIQVSASDLIKAYDDNIVAADYRYTGKLLSVSGSLMSIDKYGDSIHVHLRASEISNYVTCIFSGDSIPRLLLLKKG